QEIAHPHAAHADGRGEIKPVQRNAVLMQRWHHQPIGIHDVNDEKQDRQGGDGGHALFDSTKQQQEKREEKVEQGNGADDGSPVAADAMPIPVEFMRQIAGINNQELAEGDVGPEQHEGQQEIAKVMIMDLLDGGGEGFLPPEHGEQNDHERERDQDLPTADNDAE